MKIVALLARFKKKEIAAMKKAYDLTETELEFLMNLHNKRQTYSNSFLSKFLSN